MKLTEIYNICVPESKRKTDKMIPWVYYVMRPISILMTKPLLRTNITPVNVTFTSMVATLIGFVLIGFGQTLRQDCGGTWHSLSGDCWIVLMGI